MHHDTLVHRPVAPEIEALAAKHERSPEAVLGLFRTLQERYGSIDVAMIHDVARALNIPAQRAFGVATFYTMLATTPRALRVLRVCDSPACWLRGAGDVLARAQQVLGADWHVERNSCLGLCDRAPAALIGEEQGGPLLLDAFHDTDHAEGHPTYEVVLPGEQRVLLRGLGAIDPSSLASARAQGAYAALGKVLREPWAPERLVAEVEASGHCGRGGAGFPTALKWRFVAKEAREPRYVVCNADESEPLVFKDRVLMETNPHQVLEGMALAGYAVGAHEGYIYIRGEYEAQARLLERAIGEALHHDLLGDRILGTDFAFHVHLHRGAGAYICGEESALLESLEGKRGAPRFRPPYPTSFGFRGLPTLVNNVETLAYLPFIVREGAAAFRSLGNGTTPGTKLYTLLGHVRRPGLFEAPFGLTLRRVIEEFGGGMREGATFAFALSGGAAGTIVPPALLDVPIDYGSHARGVSLGAGAFLVCDGGVSVAALVRELLRFFEMESCGKCTPCRAGTREARAILDRIAAGTAAEADAARLHELATVLERASLCGLGQSAAWPIQSALRHFPEAFRCG